MNQPEDILSLGELDNLPDYSIYRKQTPSIKRYPSSARKTLSRWYISFVKNNNPNIKYKYWISVNGYLDNKNLIQSSPIIDIESPFVILTANTKYYLLNNSDVLKNPPHSRFDLCELSKFSNGFPTDWKTIVAQQITEIFGASRIKPVALENEKVLTPFDSIYNKIFMKDDERENLKQDKRSSEDYDEDSQNLIKDEMNESLDFRKDLLEDKFVENNKDDVFNLTQGSSILNERERSFNNPILTNHKIGNMSDYYSDKVSKSYMSNSSSVKEDYIRNSSLLKSDSLREKSTVGDSSLREKSTVGDSSLREKSTLGDSSLRDKSTLGDSSLRDKSTLGDSSIRSQIAHATLKSQIIPSNALDPINNTTIKSNLLNSQVDEKSSNNSEEIEIVSKSILNRESNTDKNITDIFLEDNINSIFNINTNSLNEKSESSDKKLTLENISNEMPVKFDDVKASDLPTSQNSSISKITDSDILAISQKLVNKGSKSFDNVMSVINSQKTQKNIPKGKSRKPSMKDQFLFDDINFDKILKKDQKKSKANDEVSDFFINSSFNIPEKDKESIITNMSQYKVNKKTINEEQPNKNDGTKVSKITLEDVKEEDYLQDSHIIASILNLGNVIENSSFKPNDSDKVNISVANRIKKEEVRNNKKLGDSVIEDKSSKHVEEKSNKSMLEEFMHSQARRPYPYEESSVKKKTTPKKKLVTKSEINTSKLENEQNKKSEELESKVEESINNKVEESINNKVEESVNNKVEESVNNKVEGSINNKVEEPINNKVREDKQVKKFEELKSKEKPLNIHHFDVKGEPTFVESPIKNLNEKKELTFKELKEKLSKEDSSLSEQKGNLSTISQNIAEEDATTVSQKNLNIQKKKKKGRTSLCMPRKPSVQKKQN